MKILYGADAEVVSWVARHTPHVSVDGYGSCTALGIISEDRQPMAGIVYHDYQPRNGTIQMSVAAECPRWATKNILRGLFAYPFRQLGVNKVWAGIAFKNARARRFVEGIGFKQEAILSRHFGDDHCVIYRMFRNDYEKRYEVKQ